MTKQFWKPGNFVYPMPVVMVSCGQNIDSANIITVAWTGTICTNPPMVYISVRPERHSYKLIKESGEFVINLVTENLTFQCDGCGVLSGKNVNKFEKYNLTPEKAQTLNTFIIKESPVNIECRVKEVLELGSHHMFIADVTGINVDEKLIDETGKFHLNEAKPVAYSHGEYRGLKEKIGKFGYSVEKKKK